MNFSRLHAGRWQVMQMFESFMIENMPQKYIAIAVVGGSEDEPELQCLQQLGINYDVTLFGISGNGYNLDLNFEHQVTSEFKGKFDLVICCQVLEHVWNMQAAIDNLELLTSVGGLIYINVPASNMKHESPEYFSAGYQPKLFINLLSLRGIETLLAGDTGSKRLYFMIHKQQYWPTYLEHRFPFLRGIQRSPWLFPLRFVKYFVSNFQSLFWSSKFMRSSQFSTETFYLGKKLNDRA